MTPDPPIQPLQPHRGPAILTLGILGCAIGCFGLVMGLIAWNMGNADLRAMDEGRMDPAGRSLTISGRICGIVGTCFQSVMVCFGLLWLIFVISMGVFASHLPAPHH